MPTLLHYPAWSATLSRAMRRHAAILAALLACCALPPNSARADACGPAPGGPPASCPAGGPASISSGAPDAGAGNPINVITGNKYQREEDMPALPGVLGLEIVRHYNSAHVKPGSPAGPMGRGWKLSYETELFDRYGRIQILQADGARIVFNRDPRHPSLCSTPRPANGRMTLAPNAQGTLDYVWRWPNGRRLYFNHAGKLERILAPTGEALTLYYSMDNALLRVTDPQGRSLALSYLEHNVRAGERFHGVQAIDSPVGRFSYEYGSAVPKGSIPFDARILLANLVRVRLPTRYEPDRPAHPLTSRGSTTSTVSRLYHHEDPRFPWLLTGISIEAMVADKPVTTRYATYGYDSNGLANLSAHANNVDKVTLSYPSGGTTVLTNSLGQHTAYRHGIAGGEFRLLEVRGAGCVTCGETNVRYGYDKLGQWVETTRLGADGSPLDTTRRELDPLGRIVNVHKAGYRNGKPGPLQWLLRYAYQGEDDAPALIARPSVVPGREQQTRITYNAAAQPLSVTELGWIPTADGRRAAARIERTTTYAYATINGRSLLTRIDGPLPNGPANSPLDSDVTIFEYDHRPDSASPSAPTGKLVRYDEQEGQRSGLLTRIIAPGNLVTEVGERDAAQRPTLLRMSDDGRNQVLAASYNWRGAPDTIEVSAGALRRRFHYDYTASGQLHAVTRPGNLRSTVEYDQAGRVSRIILPDGSGVALTHDTEGHTTGMARHRDMDASDAPLSLTRFMYDHAAGQPGRLAAVTDGLGQLTTYRHNDAGQVIALANALGVRTALEYNSDGLPVSRTEADGSPDAATVRLAYDSAGNATGITAPNGVWVERRYDDFGRKVFEADPDRGITLFRHDAAGRLLARIDETGATTRYAYDAAGRLLTVGTDGIPNLLQHRYRAGLLAQTVSTTDGKPEHAIERLGYEYDALGRLTVETRWQADVAARDAGGNAGTQGLSFETRYEYDDAGRVVRHVLPDGHVLHYRYAPAGERQAGHRSGQLDAILFDDRIVVAGIEQSMAGGLTGYTMSNGARQHITLDPRGRIAQLHAESGEAVPHGSAAAWWRRVRAWLSPGADLPPAMLYRQVNRYDPAGHLAEIERQPAVPEGQLSAPSQHEHYAYDQLDRLTGITASDGSQTAFRYDQAGNRIAESGVLARTAGLRTVARENGQDERRFSYAPGSNRLVGIMAAAMAGGTAESMAGGTTGGTAAPSPRTAWLYHATGLPLAQVQWQSNTGTTSRRIVYNTDRRPIAVDDNGQRIARYHYNSRGERIAKTVYPARPALTHTALQGETRYYLYHNQRLAAETDRHGRITTHYVYLYGKPVARIEMRENTTLLHRVWKAITSSSGKTASDRLPHVYAIVTDHLGTPQEVLDEHRHVVWQATTSAFGQARVTYAATGPDGLPFQMNLRLPGQVYDAETGLHYNYLRDYDPATGRYTTPDPMGLGGANPYAYVSNNPLTNIDPLGLYQSDIHYYMTFFLGVAAGVNPDEARTIALAAQYIDDNPDTRPLNLSTGLSDAHRARLLTYHFTMVTSNVDPATGLVSGSDDSADPLHYGDPPASPAYANITENTQLGRLSAAVTSAGDAGNLTNARCTQLQFFGEYLHAFEDTFAHRDSNNMPFALNEGLGHGLYGSHPDYTYNHKVETSPTGQRPPAPPVYWYVNEDRTLEAEKEVFAKLAAWGDASKAKNFDGILKTLQDFNMIHETEGSGETTEERQKGYPKKINHLQATLKTLGYSDIDITKHDQYGFNTDQAKKNRNDYLHDKDGNPLDQKLYSGTILPK